MPDVTILLIVFLPILLAFIAGMAMGRSGREKLRRELAYALGQLKESNDKADKMTEIAGKALTVAQERHFPASAPLRSRTHPAASDYLVAFHCPNCGFEERDTWTQKSPIRSSCPSCGYTGDGQLARPLKPFNYHAAPDPFRVENCPECLVSVRAAEWPQECPACHCVFGFDLTS